MLKPNSKFESAMHVRRETGGYRYGVVLILSGCQSHLTGGQTGPRGGRKGSDIEWYGPSTHYTTYTYFEKG